MLKIFLVSLLMLSPWGGHAKVTEQSKSRTIQLKTGQSAKIGPSLKIKLLGVSHKITTEGDRAMIEIELIDKASPETETMYIMNENEWKGHFIRLIDTDESTQPRTAKIEVGPSSTR